MKSPIVWIAAAALTLFSFGEANAQLTLGAARLYPANPTSADSLTLGVDLRCDEKGYIGNSYRVNMVQNNIIVRLGERRTDLVFPATCPLQLAEELEIGRLPVGNYTLTVIKGAAGTTPSVTLVDSAPFTIANARAIKPPPSVRLDYTGQWWNPADPGSGLFVWQDARDPNDPVLAAWFTYSGDGKPQWFVFQPKWASSTSTLPADLLQTSRMPSLTIPPPNPTTTTASGTASLDFTNFGTGEEGVFTVTLKDGAAQVIKIQRFRP